MGLNDGSARLHHVAGVEVRHAIMLCDFGVVHVPAQHAIDALLARMIDDIALELADEIHGPFDFALEERRQRPVA